MPDTSHIDQARQWLREHEAIPKEECKHGCSQTVERCHAHQMKYGPCVFTCKHRLNELDEPDFWRSKYQANPKYDRMKLAAENANE